MVSTLHFLHVNNKLFSFSAPPSPTVCGAATCSFPVPALLPEHAPVAGTLHPVGPPRPSLESLLTEQRLLQGRHLSCLPTDRLVFVPREPVATETPNFLSSGDWLQGLLPSQEYHRAGLIKPPIVSQGPASSLLSGAGIPFQEQDSGRKCGGVLISQPPKQSPLGQSAAGGMRTVHLLALPLWPPPAQATAHAGLPGPARWRPWKLSSPSWQGRGVLGLCPLGSGLPLP